MFLDGNTFTNCKSDQYRNASAHCMQRNTKNIHQPSFRLRDLTVRYHFYALFFCVLI